MFKVMKASSYVEKRATWPGFFQPKYDGIRCLHNVNETWTRNLKPHKDHIREWLLSMETEQPDNWTLDGELMLPRDRFTFQDTVSVVKKFNENIQYLEYHPYDYVPDRGDAYLGTCPFDRRMVDLGTLNYSDSLVPVPTYNVADAAEFDAYCRQYIDAGWEGGIYRSACSEYLHGSSGRNLMKYKEFLDSEYTIIAVWEGEGKFEGCAVLRFARPDYVEGEEVTKKNSFGATFPGKIIRKKIAWECRDILMGKEVTLKYQELTDDGVPRFPVALEVRDYE